MLSKQSWFFIIVNFAITWGFWVVPIWLKDPVSEPGNVAFIFYVLGGLLGPVIAAFISKKKYSNSNEFRSFLQSLWKIKVNYSWYFIVLLLPLLLTFFPRFIHYLFTGELDLSTNQVLWMAVITLPTFIIGGGLEEIGWRGVLLPDLLKKYSPFQSTAIIIVFWSIWHLPLWFMSGTVQNGSNFVIFLLGVAGTSLVLTMIYSKTKSVFLCILYHAFTNSYLATIGNPIVQLSNSEDWISSVLKLTVCIILFLLFMNVMNSKTVSSQSSKANY